MKLRERDQDPNVVRELEAVDAALAGAPVEDEFAALAALAEGLQAERPGPDPGFAAALDEAAATGFKDEGEPAGAPSRGRVLKLQLPAGMRPFTAVATAASVLLALAVSVSVLQSGSGQPGEDVIWPADGDAPAAAEDLAPPSPPSSSPAPGGGVAGGSRSDKRQEASIGDAATVLPPGVPPEGERPRLGRERVEERSAALTLSTEPDDLREVADGVIDVTDRHRGFVEASNISSGEGSAQRASFSLRVPSENLSALLADLSALAQVVSRNEGSLDITAPFVSAGERFADSKAAIARILEELEGAGSATEIAALRAQLRSARAEHAAARSQLRQIKQRAGLSRVDVTLTADGEAGWSFGDAIDDAGGVLEAIAGAALIGLAGVVPLAILGALGWFGSAGWRRRRRESGLE